MGTKSRDRLYGAAIRIAAERAARARKEADRLACDAWNKRMLGYKGPAQPSPTLGDALNAGYCYLEVRCLGCDTNQTVALDVVRRPKTTPVHELERYMRCKDCSQLRGYPYKRSALVALRKTKIFGDESGLDLVARRTLGESSMAEGQTKLCFVIGPIGEAGSDVRIHADWVLEGIIRPVFRAEFPDYLVQRADEIKAPGDISSQIINRLISAPLVIVDMNMHNANAFYELAVRHMVRLPTIHMIHNQFKIPFDVAPYRAIYFARNEYKDIEAAREELASVVREVTQDGFQVENPITHARAKFDIDQHATPAVQALAEEVAALRGKLDDVEHQVAGNQQAMNRALGSPPLVGYRDWPWNIADTAADATLRADIAKAYDATTRRSND